MTYCAMQLSPLTWCGATIAADDLESIQLESGEYLCGKCVDRLLTVARDTAQPLKPVPENFRRKPVEMKVRRGWML